MSTSGAAIADGVPEAITTAIHWCLSKDLRGWVVQKYGSSLQNFPYLDKDFNAQEIDEGLIQHLLHPCGHEVVQRAPSIVPSVDVPVSRSNVKQGKHGLFGARTKHRKAPVKSVDSGDGFIAESLEEAAILREQSMELEHHNAIHVCWEMGAYQKDRALALESANLERHRDAFDVTVYLAVRHGLLPIVLDSDLLQVVYKFYALRQTSNNVSSTASSKLGGATPRHRRAPSKKFHKIMTMPSTPAKQWNEQNQFASCWSLGKGSLDDNPLHGEWPPAVMTNPEDLASVEAFPPMETNNDLSPSSSGEPRRLAALDAATILLSVASLTVAEKISAPKWWEKGHYGDHYSKQPSACTHLADDFTSANVEGTSVPDAAEDDGTIMLDISLPPLTPGAQRLALILLIYHYNQIKKTRGSFHSDSLPPGLSSRILTPRATPISKSGSFGWVKSEMKKFTEKDPKEEVVLHEGTWATAACDPKLTILYRKQTVGLRKNAQDTKKSESDDHSLLSVTSTAIIETNILNVISVLNDCELYKSWIPYFNFPVKLGLREVKKLHQLGRADQIMYIGVDLPWPMSDRDMVVTVMTADDFDANSGLLIRIANCTPRDAHMHHGLPVPPPSKGTVRMTMDCFMLLRPLTNSTTQFKLLVKVAPQISVSQFLLDFFGKVFAKTTFNAFSSTCVGASAPESPFRQRRCLNQQLYGFLSWRLLDINRQRLLMSEYPQTPGRTGFQASYHHELVREDTRAAQKVNDKPRARTPKRILGVLRNR